MANKIRDYTKLAADTEDQRNILVLDCLSLLQTHTAEVKDNRHND